MKDSRKVKLTNEQMLSNLRDEYKANIDLWIYDATFRNQRSVTFLNINTALLVALSILITISPSIRNTAVASALISVFGLMTCTMWRQIMRRNAAYMNFRRYQLRGLEVQLQNVTTFGNQWKALNEYETLSLAGLEDTFQIGSPAKISAIDTENRMPLLLSGLWALIWIGGIAVLVLSILGRV